MIKKVEFLPYSLAAVLLRQLAHPLQGRIPVGKPPGELRRGLAGTLGDPDG